MEIFSISNYLKGAHKLFTVADNERDRSIITARSLVVEVVAAHHSSSLSQSCSCLQYSFQYLTGPPEAISGWSGPV